MLHAQVTHLKDAAQPPLYFIGLDSHGFWVIRSACGSCGGLFATRAGALKFAMSESDGGPHVVVDAPGTLELDGAQDGPQPAAEGSGPERLQ